jgi:N-acetylglutamate synthase-like GNAT family acetyltransferase
VAPARFVRIVTPMTVRAACPEDAPGIHAVLRANVADPSLFQQSEPQIASAIDEFLVAEDRAARIVGCVAVHAVRGAAEILAVAVHPDAQGRGVGGALVEAAVARARALQPPRGVWLGTAKPAYFGRFGFEPFSRWRLPIAVLLGKLALVFRQAPPRWLPAVFGRHVFMRLAP